MGSFSEHKKSTSNKPAMARPNQQELGAAGTITAILSSAGALAKPVSEIVGGKAEGKDDLKKQQIQDQLTSMGYPGFSMMSGFSGNEQKKREAMQLILNAIKADPANAQQIRSWLEGGQVTPNTAAKIRNSGMASLGMTGNVGAAQAGLGSNLSNTLLYSVVGLGAAGGGYYLYKKYN